MHDPISLKQDKLKMHNEKISIGTDPQSISQACAETSHIFDHIVTGNVLQILYLFISKPILRHIKVQYGHLLVQMNGKLKCEVSVVIFSDSIE